MKKLMIALTVVAAAIAAHAVDAIAYEGFNAPGSSVPLTGAPFTSIEGTNDCSISTTGYSCSQLSTIAAPDGWRGLGAGGYNLTVKTALTTPAYFTMPASSAAQVYFDAMVKFTACDTDAEVPSGSNAKIMVWTKELTDANDNVTGTNLMVTAGYLYNSDNSVSNKVYDCGALSTYGVVSDTDWCRLTIKAVKDVSASGYNVAGFVVFINGNPAVISTGYREIGVAGSAVVADLARNMIVWNSQHKLFPSLIPGTATFSAVGVAGQGGLDDLIAYTGEPTNDGGVQFALDEDPTIATVGSVECKTVTAINTAIAAASSGAAVQLFESFTGDLTFEVAAAFTLDLNGFTLTGTGESESSAVTADKATLTITDSSTGKAGKIDGNVYGDPKITLVAGKISVAGNSDTDIAGNVTTAADKMLAKCDNDTYWTVVDREDGTAAYPFKLTTQADFANKIVVGAAGAGKCYKLMNDIALEGTWAGIGAYGKGNVGNAAEFAKGAFAGVFDGNGKTISGLKLKSDYATGTATNKYIGLFFSTYGATIKNLKVGVANYGWDNGKSIANDVGGGILVGTSWNSTFENVEILKGTEAGTDQFYGTHALAAFAAFTTGTNTYRYCTNNIDIVEARANDTSKVAAFSACQQNNAPLLTLVNCANNGNISAQSSGAVAESAVAGLVAYANAGEVTFQNCSNSGTISAVSTAVTPYEFVLANGAAVTDLGGCTGTGNALAAAGNVTGFDYLSNAGYVAAKAVVKDGSVAYKAVKADLTLDLGAVGNKITLDTSLVSVTVNTTVENAYVAQSGNVYTVTAKTTPAITVTFANPVVEYTAGLTFPTPTVTVEGGLTFKTSWDQAAITEPAAGTTNTYTCTVSVAATDTTLANSQTAEWKVFKAAAGGGTVSPSGSPVQVQAESAEAATNGVVVSATSPDETIVTSAEYSKYFQPVASKVTEGVYNVTAELKPEIVKAEAETATVAATLDSVAAGTASSAEVTNAKPGLYYSVKYTDSVSGMGTANEGERAQADVNGSVTIPMPKTADGASAQFYQIQVNTTDKGIVQ